MNTPVEVVRREGHRLNWVVLVEGDFFTAFATKAEADEEVARIRALNGWAN